MPARALFLSYASQDAVPALRIVESLRAAGLDVWFDQNELVGLHSNGVTPTFRGSLMCWNLRGTIGVSG